MINATWERVGLAVVLILCAGLSPAARAGEEPPAIYINELMARNDTGIVDEDGDTEDWIELYNASSAAVNLSQYVLSDSPGDPTHEWAFPEVTISPSEFMLVWASNKDRSQVIEKHNHIVKAEGTQIWGDSDSFRFEAVGATGDFEMVVRVESLFETSAAAQAGLMIRESLDPDSRNVMIGATPVDGFTMQWRDETGGASTGSGGNPPVTYPYAYAKLVRQGDFVSGYQSTGDEWEPVGTVTIPDLSDSVHIGLAVSSHAAGELTTAVFSGLSFAPTEVVFGDLVATDIDCSASGSSETVTTTSRPLHTNFQLDADGDQVGLYMPDGTTVDELTFAAYSSDVSYGRKPDGTVNWWLFEQPTPGGPNTTGGTVAPSLSPVVFIPAGGFHSPNGSLAIAMTCQAEGAEIRYTLDGSEPTRSSSLYNPADPPRISISRAVRARAFVDDMTFSRTTTDAYLLNETIDMPVIVLMTDKSNLWGSSGIYTNASTRGLERPATVEYYNATGVLEFDVDCGLRIHGGASRTKSDKKSFRLHFRDEYGPAKLDYPFFADTDVTKHDRIVLRAGFNDSWTHHSYETSDIQRTKATHVADELTRRLMLDMHEPASHGNFCRLYLLNDSGALEYWGFYNPTEGIDNDFCAAYVGGDKEDWDVIESSGATDGDTIAWSQFNNYLDSTNFSDDANFADLATKLHIENCTEYLMLNIWIQNRDWPHHNYAYARRKPDGRWYSLPWDSESSLGRGACSENPDGDMIGSIQSNGSTPAGRMFNNLLENASYRMYFLQRFDRKLNTVFHESHTIPRFDEMLDDFAPAIPDEADRWIYDWQEQLDYADWQTACENMRDWMRQRSYHVRRHLVQHFSETTGVGHLVIQAPDGAGDVEVVGTSTSEAGYPWTRPFLKNIPIELTAEPANGYRFVGWSDAELPPEPVVEVYVGGGSQAEAIIEPGAEWFFDDTGTDLHTQMGDAWRTLTDQAGWGVGSAQLGYGDGDEAQVISFGGDASHKRQCYYFRHVFNVEDAGAFPELRLSLVRDDGAVIYLNGTEILRSNMPDGDIAYTTFAADVARTAVENDWHEFTIDNSQLVTGTNVIAVEVHQSSFTSSDISFDLSLSPSSGAPDDAYQVHAIFEPGPGGEAWRVGVGEQVRSSAAIADDGTVYFGADDGMLRALNPDGSEKWALQTLGAIRSAPMIDDSGVIYVGSREGCIYAVNSDGSVRWKFTDPVNPLGNADASPTLTPTGLICVGADNGVFYALTPDGAVEWQYVVGQAINSKAAIAGDGTIVFGSNDNRVYALNADGSEKWTFRTAGDVLSSPAIASDGTVYAGSKDDRLYAINPDGTMAWMYTTGANVRSSPVAGPDGVIYFGSSDDSLYALNGDGTLRWRFTGTDDFDSSPLVGADGNIYAASSDGRVYCFEPNPLDPENIEPIWTYTFGTGDTNVDASPVMADDGTIYLGCDDGALAAIVTDAGGPALSDWPMFGRDRRHTGSTPPIAVYGLIVNDGSGDGEYPLGTVVTINADVPGGYMLDAWTGDVENVADVYAPSTTVRMLAETEVTATFMLREEFQLNIEGGTGDGTYYTRDVVDIEATVPDGYRFDVWTGDTQEVADIHAPATTVTMHADTTVTATFVRQYELVVDGGTGGGTYDEGTVVPIEAQVYGGHAFEEWTGDSENISDVYAASTTITMLSDAAVAAQTTFNGLTASLTVQPEARYFTPGESGLMYFDVQLEHLEGCNGFSLCGVITKDGAQQDEITFDHAELHSNLVSIAEAADAKLLDVSNPNRDMISYAIIPPVNGQMGPTVEGAIARFYYNYTTAASGDYEIRLDDSPVSQGAVWSTETVVMYGTRNDANWVPAWMIIGDERIDISMLEMQDAVVTFGAAPMPSDVNRDGCVNVADLLQVRNNLGNSASGISPPEADVNGDDVVNVADLLTVRNELGSGPACPE